MKKLELPKREFPISGRSLDISETMIDYIIFSKTMIFGHFDRY